jgi:putative transposase
MPGNRRLLIEIKIAHQKSHKNYGSPRIHLELNENGHFFSKHRVAHQMSQNGIVSKQKRKFKVTANLVHCFPITKNILELNFYASEPGQCWMSDITYVPTCEGWLYWL